MGNEDEDKDRNRDNNKEINYHEDEEIIRAEKRTAMDMETA